LATFNVLVATDLTPESLELLKKAKGVHPTLVPPTLSALKPHLKEAHALIIRDDIHVDASLLDNAPQLKIIACVSISLNNVDLEVATTRGILVMNTPGVSATAAGEHTLALMLALSRRLVSAHNSLKEGYWLLDRSRQAGVQLFGKTIGVIGLGRVGSVVALRCLAFGMTVLAYDPYVSEEHVTDKRIQLAGLRDLLSRSDFISVHVPSTRETQNLLNAETLALTKKGVRIVNTAHGSVIDEFALAEALKSGQVASVAIDVYREVPPYNNPLIGIDNVIHTPHIGDNTIEAMQDLSIKVVEQVIDALRDEDYRNVVNMPLMPGMSYESIRPYMRLAECMGTVLITLARLPIQRVAVQVQGEELVGMIKPITVGILKGLLFPIVGNAVSTVNAPILATERGWHITQTKALPSGEYSNNVSCQVTLEDGENIVIVGTLLDHREPHIVQINQYRMNFVPSGYLLLMGSYDRPGVIGKVGTLLSERKVNIASWHTGRVNPGGNTLTVLTLDEPIPDDVLNELRALDFVRHAHQMKI
jgi:D-3-phosphoglycerate dehydrogenase / 2-oxoglutarate reductase